MSEVFSLSHDDTLTREQWAALTAAGRRRARFTYIMRRARRDVQGDPPLTDTERAEVAQIWLSGPDGAHLDSKAAS